MTKIRRRENDTSVAAYPSFAIAVTNSRMSAITSLDVSLRGLPAPNRKPVRCRRLFERSAVNVVDGASKTVTHNSVVGNLVTFHFCPGRGSTVFWGPSACSS
jgi:hypothetical protein